MPIVNRVADLQPDIQAWRRDIHQHPELLYDVHRTAAFVAERLREFGCDEVVTGLGRTGVVGVIKGRKPAGKGAGNVLGLRADMDALPIEGDTKLAYASRPPCKMHAGGLAGAQLITALQSIVSRSVDPLESAVVSMCEFHAGNARNVIPQTAELRGTVRTLTAEVRELVERRVREVVAGVAQITGAKIDLVYERGYPVTVNHAAQTDLATQVAKDVAGDANVHESPPLMGAEDFAYMLEARPGAFLFCGNGDSAGLHHPAYNLNDDAIVYGTSHWIKLVENTLAA